MGDCRFYRVTSKGKLNRVDTVGDALDNSREPGFAWLDFYRCDQQELSSLLEPLGLHPLAIEDCVDTDQVPKIEDFPGNTFIIFNALAFTGEGIAVDEVDLFIGQKFLVTISGHDSEDRRPLNDIERIVERDIDNARQGPAFLMHLVLDFIVDRKSAAIEALEDRLNNAEEQMLADPGGFNPAEMLHVRRDLLSLRKSLFNEREIMVKICRRDCQYISEKAIFHYRDIYDHLAKFFELAEAYRDIVTSLMELHASMLNNVMAKASNQMNATVRRLTFITTIFMPLTLLAGIGGMSEWSMMTGPENWKWSYPLFFLIMGVVGVANYYLLRRLED